MTSRITSSFQDKLATFLLLFVPRLIVHGLLACLLLLPVLAFAQRLLCSSDRQAVVPAPGVDGENNARDENGPGSVDVPGVEDRESGSADFLDGLHKLQHISIIKCESVTFASRIMARYNAWTQIFCAIGPLMRPLIKTPLQALPYGLGLIVLRPLTAAPEFLNRLIGAAVHGVFGFERPFAFLIEGTDTGGNKITFLVTDARSWWQKLFRPADMDLFANGKLAFTLRHIDDFKTCWCLCAGNDWLCIGKAKRLLEYTSYVEVRDAAGELAALTPLGNSKLGCCCCAGGGGLGSCLKRGCCSLCIQCKHQYNLLCQPQPLSAQPTPAEDLLETGCCDQLRPPLPTVMSRGIEDIMPMNEMRCSSQSGFQHPNEGTHLPKVGDGTSVTLMIPGACTNCNDAVCGNQGETVLKPYDDRHRDASGRLLKIESSVKTSCKAALRKACLDPCFSDLQPMIQDEISTLAGFKPEQIANFMSQRKQTASFAGLESNTDVADVEEVRASTKELFEKSRLVRTDEVYKCEFPVSFSAQQKLMAITWLLQAKCDMGMVQTLLTE